MTDLATEYLGLELKNPIIAAASPLTAKLDGIRRLEDGGVSAVTLFSLFEEQIEHETALLEHELSFGSESFAEAGSYFPEPDEFHAGPSEYLELIHAAKATTSIPVIASLNGVSPGGWVDYARQMQQAGADAIELNVYWIETSPGVSGLEVEKRYVDVVAAVADAVSIPVAAKIGPYFSAIANVASQLADVGARGLVLFNRFYQPDFDLNSRSVEPALQLSHSVDMRLPLHWTAILFGRVPADLAITSGVHTAHDVLKAMMAGARVASMASALLRHGPSHVGSLLREIEGWMLAHEYGSIRQMRGSMSYRKVPNPSAFERANYMKELQSYRPDPAVQGLA